MRDYSFSEKTLQQYEDVIKEISRRDQIDSQLRYVLHSAHNLSSNQEFLDNFEKLNELSSKKKRLEKNASRRAVKIAREK